MKSRIRLVSSLHLDRTCAPVERNISQCYEPFAHAANRIHGTKFRHGVLKGKIVWVVIAADPPSRSPLSAAFAIPVILTQARPHTLSPYPLIGKSMTKPDFTNPREAARVFTPKLSALVDSPLYSQVWEDADLSKRDRSLITVAALVALGHSDELPAHLRRAISNGVTRTEL